MISIKDLKEAILFKGLNTRELQLFAKHFEQEEFKAGEVIFLQGSRAENLFILIDGEVALGIKAKGEIDITAYSVGKKGEAFGLSSLIKPYQNNVTAFCNRRTRVLLINGEIFRKLIKQNRKAGMEIMERVVEIYYNRLNSVRAMIINLFKMFKVQTGKSKLMEAYYEA